MNRAGCVARHSAARLLAPREHPCALRNPLPYTSTRINVQLRLVTHTRCARRDKTVCSARVPRLPTAATPTARGGCCTSMRTHIQGQDPAVVWLFRGMFKTKRALKSWHLVYTDTERCAADARMRRSTAAQTAADKQVQRRDSGTQRSSTEKKHTAKECSRLGPTRRKTAKSGVGEMTGELKTGH